MLLLRPFKLKDLQTCLSIFDSNIPVAFSIVERMEFESFLKQGRVSYYVVENLSNDVVAGGGLKLEPQNGIAKLRWGMAQRQQQHQGIGSFLTLARLRKVLDCPEILQVRLGTSQAAVGFYRKMGFERESFVPDGILPGFDEYQMYLVLDEKRKEWILNQWMERYK